MKRNNFNILQYYLNDLIDDINYSLNKIRNEIEDSKNNFIQERPDNINSWIATGIKLLPDNIDLGTALKIEELLTNIKG